MSKKNNETYNKPEEKNNELAKSRIAGIGIGLLILAGVILITSGTFDIPESKQAPVNQMPDDNIHNHVDLGALQKINELEEQVKNNPGNLNLLLSLGHLLNDSGIYDKAVERYQTYLKSRPTDTDVLVDMGVCYFELKQLDNAQSAMEKALQINPDHQIGNFNLGIVLLSKGQHDLAVKYWKKAIEINPDSEIGKRAAELINSH